MHRTRIAVLVALVLTGITWSGPTAARAQSDDRSLLDVVGDLGRSILGTDESRPQPQHQPQPRPTTSNNNRYTAPRPSAQATATAPPLTETPESRQRSGGLEPRTSGIIRPRFVDNANDEAPRKPSETKAAETKTKAPVTTAAAVEETRETAESSEKLTEKSPARPKVVVAPTKKRWGTGSAFDDDDAGIGFSVATAPKANPPAERQPTASDSPVDSGTNSGEDSRPLYQRMKGFRQSVFASESSGTSAAAEAAPAAEEKGGMARSRTASVVDQAAEGETPAKRTIVEAPPAGNQSPQLSAHTSIVNSSENAPFRPRVAERSSASPEWRTSPPAGVAANDAVSTEAPAAAASTGSAGIMQPRSVAAPTTTVISPAPASMAQPSLTTSPAVTRPVPAVTAAPATRPLAAAASAGAKGGGILLARQSPVLNAETIGPRKIIVGRESPYEITIVNSADVPAEELVVLVDLPKWAEVQATETTVGATQLAAGANDTRQLQWNIGRLEARSRERLALRIVPRESRPFELAIRWDFKQASVQAMIEVQEPKLAAKLEGPREVLFGKREMYRLRISNSGTGDAENVLVRLFPLGSDSAAVTHNFGTIAPGEERAVEVELVARQSGTLTMKLDAQCDGGAKVELAEPVVVRRAALQVSVEGPRLQFVDSVAVYHIRIQNPGTAPARNINVTAIVPAGMKFVAGSDNPQPADSSSAVRWHLDGLNPSAEKVLEFKGNLGQAGIARLEIAAQADDDVNAAGSALTRVDTVADLVMEVVDPTGPVPVGDDAIYELRLLNRGTRAADAIEVVAFFSQGIEPVTVQGAPHRIAPGQVSFNTIPALGPGRELRLKIHAKAQLPGTHVFRAELHCKPLSTRLVREETTLFYAADMGPTTPVVSAPAQQSSPAMMPIRTAERTPSGYAAPNGASQIPLRDPLPTPARR